LVLQYIKKILASPIALASILGCVVESKTFALIVFISVDLDIQKALTKPHKEPVN